MQSVYIIDSWNGLVQKESLKTIQSNPHAMSVTSLLNQVAQKPIQPDLGCFHGWGNMILGGMFQRPGKLWKKEIA